MYGERVDSKEVLGESLLEFKSLAENAMLMHAKTPFDEYEKTIILGRDEELRLYPLPPINTPSQITEYLLYRLDKPIVVPPEGKVSVTIETLIEIGVGVFSRSRKKVRDYIDFIPPYHMKYCLYGKPNNGVIARLIPTPIHFTNIFETPQPPLKALTTLEIINESNTTVTVRRVLVNGDSMIMYFNEQDRLFTNKVTLYVTSENMGYTILSRTPPLPGLMRSPKPSRGRISFFEGFSYESKKTEMKHGFNNINFLRS